MNAMTSVTNISLMVNEFTSINLYTGVLRVPPRVVFTAVPTIVCPPPPTRVGGGRIERRRGGAGRAAAAAGGPPRARIEPARGNS